MRGRLTCLHSDFFVHGSLGFGNALVICKGDDWRSFMSIEGEKRCLQKGLEVFSDEIAYQQYSQGFRKYIETAKEKIIPRFKNEQENITWEELNEILSFLGKFWHFYGMTEFSYHDLAYEKSLETNNSVLKSNLDDLGKLKFSGRELMNAYLFEGGVFHALLLNVGNRFLKDPSDASFLFKHEIKELFEGVAISGEELKKRRQVYGCAVTEGATEFFTYEKSVSVWDDFCGAQAGPRSISGTVASRGIASGRVVIAPMLVDMKEILKIDSEMQQGDILVAESTTPDLMMLCKKAAAIITDQGGMLSHAAIISRELGIPCIIGTGKATHILKNGDLVEIDADRGKITILSK